MQPPPYDQAIAGPSKPPRKVGACVDGMYGCEAGLAGWLFFCHVRPQAGRLHTTNRRPT